MKEIKYLGNFSEDLENVMKPVSFKDKVRYFFKRYSFVFSFLLFLEFMILGIVNIGNIIVGKLVLPSIMLMVGMFGVGIVTFCNLKNIRSIDKSNEEIFKLRRDLSINYDVNISKESICNSKFVGEKEKTFYVYKGNKEIPGVEFIRYFELLDRDGRIQVLKSVRDVLLNDYLGIDEEEKLFLLESGDKELDEIKKRRLVP